MASFTAYLMSCFKYNIINTHNFPIFLYLLLSEIIRKSRSPCLIGWAIPAFQLFATRIYASFK